MIRPGRHRHPVTLRMTGIFGLVIALSAAAAMLLSRPEAQTASPLKNSELTLEQAYPGKQAKPVKTAIADGAPFTPLYFPDGQRGFGTAPASDGALRLILITAAGERELRRLPKAQAPEYAGFASRDKQVVWMELTATSDGSGETRLWTIDSAEAAPRLITADTGDVALFDKRDDVVIHDSAVTWLAAARTQNPVTEIRTAPLRGGKVRVEPREGAWSISGWPWLSTVDLGQNGPVELFNLESLERVVVGVQTNELMACSPRWCRALIVGTEPGSTVIELLRTDGSLRLRAAAGTVAAAIVDVALLDRYEIYSYSGGKLVLFDLELRRAITLARNISQVSSRGHVLWWATGDNETLTWHVLDLSTLEPGSP